jgi:CPA1 family monovalent cation:H+ antiporter
MNFFDIASILLTTAAAGSYINFKLLKQQSSIGLLVFAIGLGLIGIFLKKLGLITYSIDQFLSNINFQEIVFHGMLSFLLFAGALQISIKDLKSAKFPIAITATISTLISTILIGIAFYYLAHLLEYRNITFLDSMLFGAILSPTDPIAALSIIKKLAASKKIETTIIGESLFNDGIAIVLFLTILELIKAEKTTQISNVISLIVYEVGGGLLLGGLIGGIAYYMLLKINAYQTELLITLAVATGGYALTDALDFSGPLAMVVAGLIIGNHGRQRAMSIQTEKYIISFWEVIDDILNTVLFLLIGIEMMVIHINGTIIVFGFGCIVIALLARFISIAIPITLLQPFYDSKSKAIIILTWGGLRGALSIAMVLSLSQQSIKEIFLPCIYFVVFFYVTIQGLTLGNLLKKLKLQ